MKHSMKEKYMVLKDQRKKLLQLKEAEKVSPQDESQLGQKFVQFVYGKQDVHGHQSRGQHDEDLVVVEECDLLEK